jgi:hypothetical protein
MISMLCSVGGEEGRMCCLSMFCCLFCPCLSGEKVRINRGKELISCEMIRIMINCFRVNCEHILHRAFRGSPGSMIWSGLRPFLVRLMLRTDDLRSCRDCFGWCSGGFVQVDAPIMSQMIAPSLRSALGIRVIFEHFAMHVLRRVDRITWAMVSPSKRSQTEGTSTIVIGVNFAAVVNVANTHDETVKSVVMPE